MRNPQTATYYRNQARQLGWGEDSAVLDNQRLKLLNKYVVGEKVLDVGCATGIYVNYLSNRNLKSYGVDIVHGFIQNAQKKYPKAEFKTGSAENIPYSRKLFDTTILFDILEHGDDIKILKEAIRVTKSRILVIVPRVVDQDLESAGVVFRHYIDKSHLREYKKNDFNKLAEKTNLKLIHLESVHNLYNETIFLSLFSGPLFIKKVIRKLIFFLLPKKNYPTEYFAVFYIK